MDNALFNRIVELLQRHMRDKSDRKTLLDAALFGSPALNHIELTGTPFQFSSQLVNALDKYDSVKIVDILEALKQNTGENNHPEIDTLIQDIRQLQPPSHRDLEPAYLDSILEKYNHWLKLYHPEGRSICHADVPARAMSLLSHFLRFLLQSPATL